MTRRTLTASLPALLLLATLSATLGGCAGLLSSDAPPSSEWWLEATAPATPVERGTQTLVLDLTVVPGLDTDRILNLGPQARLNHYAGAFWPDHLPEVLASVLARSFEQSGWRAVRLDDRVRNDDECLLTLETRAFYGRVNRENLTEQVETRFDGALVCDETRKPVSTRQAVSVTENRMGSIVAAFQTALGRTVEELTASMAP
jgi:ABC-type uncharacterized transport system auxiliary subunit